MYISFSKFQTAALIKNYNTIIPVLLYHCPCCSNSDLNKLVPVVGSRKQLIFKLDGLSVKRECDNKLVEAIRKCDNYNE